MNKIIFAILSLSFLLPGTRARTAASQPIVTQFLTQEMTVFEHLATILESATQMALEHDNAEDLHSNGASRRIVLTSAMTEFLNFDVKTLDESLVDADPEHFVAKVVALFNQSCVSGLTVDVASIAASRPDDEAVSAQLRVIMIGYYFAVLKEHNFDDSTLNVDWRFQEIQKKMQELMTAKMGDLVRTFQQMMFNELSERAKKFSASFKVHHQQVVVILKSFKSYAMEVLIDQLRTFYFDLAENPNLVQPAMAKDVFQRTVDMWMIAFKLCERDCETRHFASLIPNFLEEMVLMRIEMNTSIVAHPLTKTFYAKFLALLLQQNFQNNTPEDDEGNLMELNERYAMFVYRLFFSRQNRKMNKKLSNFLHDVYSFHGLNFMFPRPELEQEDPAAFAQRKESNQRYIIDLILHLDFPELEAEDVQDADKERTQPISFAEEDTLTLVQSAPNWFAFDLDKLNTEELILSWFVDYNDPAAFEDYQVMYETLAAFRNGYKGENAGEDLDEWLDKLVQGVEDKDETDAGRKDVLGKFWLMKSINMINVLSGAEYDEVFTNGFPPETNQDIVLFFRRILTRPEFAFLKKAMLQIFAYYTPEKKVYSTDLEDDKFLYEVFDMSIECEKLPEILGTEVTTINVTFRDEDDVMDVHKKKLDLGSQSSSQDSSTPIQVNESSESSQDKSSKVVIPVNPTAFDRERKSHASESSNVEILPLVSHKSSAKSPEKSAVTETKKNSPVLVSRQSSPRVEVSSENSSTSVRSREHDSPRDHEDLSQEHPSRKSKIQSNKTSEVVLEESSESTSKTSPRSTASHSQALPIADKKSPPKSRKSDLEQSSASSSQVIEVKSSSKSKDREETSFHTPASQSRKVSERSSNKVVEVSSHNSSPVIENKPSQNSSQVVIDESSENTTPHTKSYKTAIDQSHRSRAKTGSQKSTPRTSSKASPRSKVVVEESSSSSIDVEETSELTKSKPSPTSSNKILEPAVKSRETSSKTSEIKVEVSSNSSSAVHTNSHKSPQIEAKTLKDSESSPSERTPAKKSTQSGQLDQLRNRSQSKDHDSELTHSEHTKSHSTVVVEDESEQSLKKPAKSHKTIADIQREVESQIMESSSNSSETPSHQSSTRQDELNRGQKSTQTFQESSSNSSDKSLSKSNKTGKEHPLIPVETHSETSEMTQPVVVHKDEDAERRNLVYEVTGRLTPEQRRAFEFSGDIWASVKDMKIQTDEYGNQVEYVYVQIVRKDSDCYQELLKYA